VTESVDSCCPIYVNYDDKAAAATTDRVSVMELKALVSRITEEPDTLQQEFNVRRLDFYFVFVFFLYMLISC